MMMSMRMMARVAVLCCSLVVARAYTRSLSDHGVVVGHRWWPPASVAQSHARGRIALVSFAVRVAARAVCLGQTCAGNRVTPAHVRWHCLPLRMHRYRWALPGKAVEEASGGHLHICDPHARARQLQRGQVDALASGSPPASAPVCSS
jgi:hypothetical protein